MITKLLAVGASSALGIGAGVVAYDALAPEPRAAAESSVQVPVSSVTSTAVADPCADPAAATSPECLQVVVVPAPTRTSEDNPDRVGDDNPSGVRQHRGGDDDSGDDSRHSGSDDDSDDDSDDSGDADDDHGGDRHDSDDDHDSSDDD